MPSTSILNCSVYYEVYGNGVPIIITPGGRGPLDWARDLAEKTADRGYKVIVWDRPNTGHSDVLFEGANDLDLASDMLATLIERLGIAPAYVAGPSAGSRTSVRLALRYPEVVKGLFLWLVTGGSVPVRLGANYFGQYADLAEAHGMAAVADSSYWQGMIERNPANRGRLLATDPREFARVMRRWATLFLEPKPMPGISEEELRRVTQPTTVIAGYDQEGHTREVAERVAQFIPGARFIDPPGFAEEWAEIQNQFATGTGYHHVSLLPGLIDDFVKQAKEF